MNGHRPPDPEGTQYVVDFEPGLYGPFGSRDAASDWARVFTKGNGSWCVCPLGSPEHARRGYGENADGTLDVRPARYDQVDRWPL